MDLLLKFPHDIRAVVPVTLVAFVHFRRQTLLRCLNIPLHRFRLFHELVGKIMFLGHLEVLGGDPEMMDTTTGDFKLLGLGTECGREITMSGMVCMGLLDDLFCPGDLLPHFGQLLLRGICLSHFLLFGTQVLQPLLEVMYFLVDAGAISFFTTPLGLQVHSLCGFQKFGGFPLQPLGLLFVPLLGTDRGFLPNGLGTLSKLIGFGSQENSTEAEQQKAKDHSRECCALHFVSSLII